MSREQGGFLRGDPPAGGGLGALAVEGTITAAGAATEATQATRASEATLATLVSREADRQVNGALTSVGQYVMVVADHGMADYAAQITGTFVGTVRTEASFDGALTWTPTSFRQSVNGRISTNTVSDTQLTTLYTTGLGTVQGALLRGAAATATHYRVVCTAYTSGTINVVLRVGSGAAVMFPNVFLDVRALEQFYASPAGGRVMFGSGTDAITTSNLAGQIALLENPAASTIDIYVWRLAVAAGSAATIMRRYKNPTISARTAPGTIENRGGGTNAGQGRFYSAAGFSTTANGALVKTLQIAAGGTDTSDENGSIVLRPGNALLFTAATTGGVGAAGTASVECVWWETTAAV